MALSFTVFFHIVTGLAGLISGAGALVFRKGSRRHAQAGLVFVVSMLIMSATGALIAFFQGEVISVYNGILTFYLVATALMTVKRKASDAGWLEWGALLVIIGVSVGHFVAGGEAIQSETGLKDGFPAGAYFFFGGIATLAAALDGRLLYRRQLSGAQRLARHLWRMCFALFIATASFFLGQAHLFPEALQHEMIMFTPVLMVLGVMFYWLVRVRRGAKKRVKNVSAQPVVK